DIRRGWRDRLTTAPGMLVATIKENATKSVRIWHGCAEMGHFMGHDVRAGERVEWVDYAKGFCIVFVVMMHSTLGVEAAAGQQGWLHAVVEFARPFRMPDFFMISGLFLANVINRDWRTYLDRKVVHFAYFYVLWVTIQFAFKAPTFAAEHGWNQVPLL